jgi:hypothetical protein
METPPQGFTYKPSANASSTEDDDRWTFAAPFALMVGLTLPGLLVLSYVKKIPQLDALDMMGYLVIIQAVFWLIVPLTLIFGILYIIRGRGKIGKLVTGALLLLTVALFVYFLAPSQ